MHKPNPVKSIAQQPQQFQSRALPPIQSPLSMGQPPVQQFTADDPSQDLGMEIYARLVVGYMDSLAGAPDEQHLQNLAARAKLAAQAFFHEGQGNG